MESHHLSSPGCPGPLTPVRLTLLLSSVQSCSFYQPMTSLRLYDAGAGRAGSLGPRAPFSQLEGQPTCSAAPSTGAFNAAFLRLGLQSPGSWSSQPTAANSWLHKPDFLAPGGPRIPLGTALPLHVGPIRRERTEVGSLLRTICMPGPAPPRPCGMPPLS